MNLPINITGAADRLVQDPLGTARLYPGLCLYEPLTEPFTGHIGLTGNQSIIQMLAPGNVEMIGANERIGGSEGGSALLPALKLKAFNFTSQSEAV